MTLRLRFSEHALAQLEAAIAAIAEADRAAAERFTDAIEARLALLKRLPYSGRLVPELVDSERREVIVGPYRIIYSPDADAVRIGLAAIAPLGLRLPVVSTSVPLHCADMPPASTSSFSVRRSVRTGTSAPTRCCTSTSLGTLGVAEDRRQ